MNFNITKKFEDLSNEEIEDVLLVNTQTPVWITKEILPLMKKENKGSIITLISDDGKGFDDKSSAYSASKAAITALMSSIRAELQAENSQVDIILIQKESPKNPGKESPVDIVNK